MKIVIRNLGALLLLGSASTAPAQLKPEAPIGTRLPVKPEVSTTTEARTILAKFAQCAVRKWPDLAPRFVLDSSTINVAKDYMTLADDYCMSDVASLKNADVGLKISHDIMRFAIAEALVQKELGSFDPALVKLAQPLRYAALKPADYVPKRGQKYTPKELADLQSAQVVDETRIAFQRYGECVARNDPANVRLLAFSSPNSTEESAAIKALMPLFGDCLAPGQQFKTNKTMMRGTLALAYYRLARAPKKPAEATK